MLLIMKEAQLLGTKSVFLSLPAEIVGIWKMCRKSDFSIHVFYCHDVFGTFVLDFACPTKAGKHVKNKAHALSLHYFYFY